MPRIDPPMVRPRIKGEIVIGGPSGSPIRLPVGSEDQVLTAVEGSPTWTTPASTYTQAEVDAMVSILNNTGVEGQVIRVVGGSAQWDDEIDSYTKSEVDALTAPIRVPGDDGQVLGTVGSDIAWVDPVDSYTKSEVDAFTAPIRVPGSDGQVLGTVGSGIEWVDSIDSYTKSEVDAALQMRAESQHTHEIVDVAGLELELGGRSLTGHTHTATEISGIEDYVDNFVIDSVSADLEPLVIAAVADGLAAIGPADIGAAPVDHAHDISDLNVSGVADGTTYLRGDGSWAVVEGGVTSVNTQTGAVVLDAADVGAAEAAHTHAIADIDSTGTPSGTTYLRGDGTWSTPPNTNTTYSEITSSEITTGTASTARAISGRRAQEIVNKARDGVALASSLALVATSGSYSDLTGKPTIPAQINPIAGTNMSITGTYPNLTFSSSAGGAVTVDSVNGQTGAVVLDAADVGAAAAGHTHTASDVGAAEAVHTHAIADIDSTGTPSTSTYLRGDGSWATPPNTNTTYSEITDTEITAGTASTLRSISGRRAQSIVNKALSESGSLFAPIAHTHTASDVGAASADHVHGLSDIEFPLSGRLSIIQGFGSIVPDYMLIGFRTEGSTFTELKLTKGGDITAGANVRAGANNPTDPDHLTRKDYVDSAIDNHTHPVSDVSFPTSGGEFIDTTTFSGISKGSTLMRLTGSTAMIGPTTNLLTITGDSASIPHNFSISDPTPTWPAHATRKDYVDGLINSHNHAGTYLNSGTLAANDTRVGLQRFSSGGEIYAMIPLAGSGGLYGTAASVARSDHSHGKNGVSTGLTNSTTSYLDIPGLSFDIGAGETWTSEFYLQTQSQSGGMKFEIVAPVNSTVRAHIVGSGASETSFIYGITATRGGRLPSTGVNAYFGGGWARVSVVVTAGASSPGAVGLKMGAVTSGQTNTVHGTSSYFNARRVE